MLSYELAIDEDGEPFGVPPEVAGWRVRRAADGRGRPLLVHARGSEKGKPLVLRANASHAELLAAAGPGKYRLEAVDEHWHKVDGVPVACTGPLSADEEDPSEGDASAEPVGSSAGSGGRQIEDVLCQVVNANTRMVEKALGQIGTVMSGVAELLNAAHNAGITSRVPPPLPPPAPPPPVLVDSREDEEDEADEAEEAAPTSGIPEFVRLLIKEAVDKVVPLIFEKLTSGGGLGGLPLEALLDWRKAAPSPAAAPSAPAAAAAPSAPAASSGPMPSAPASWPAAPVAPDGARRVQWADAIRARELARRRCRRLARRDLAPAAVRWCRSESRIASRSDAGRGSHDAGRQFAPHAGGCRCRDQRACDADLAGAHAHRTRPRGPADRPAHRRGAYSVAR